jgi:hypothetical protein
LTPLRHVLSFFSMTPISCARRGIVTMRQLDFGSGFILKGSEVLRHTLCLLVSVLCQALFSPGAQAADSGLPAIQVQAGGSYLTYKSKLLQSNDVGLAYGGKLKILGGDDGNILVDARMSTSQVTFALNQTSLARQDLACYFGMELGWAYVGVGPGTRVVKAKAVGGEFETYSRTYGGVIGIDAELTKGSRFFWDLQGMTPYDTKETKQQDVTMGLALDTEAGTRFEVVRRSLYFGLGVRYATLSVSFGGQTGGEVMSGPFVSLQWGFDP